MATVRQYGYYIEGNKVSIVEKDTAFDNDVNSKDYGPGADRAQWKSPLATITDGLEMQYVYSPEYRIHRDTILGNDGGRFYVNGWFILDGYVAFVRSIGAGTANWGSTNKATAGSEGDTGGQSLDYIVIKGSSRWNGLHRIQTAGGAFGTLLGGILKTYTRADTLFPYVTGVDMDLTNVGNTLKDGDGDDDIFIADHGYEVGDYVWMSGHTTTGKHNGVFTVSEVGTSSVDTASYLAFDTRYYLPSKNSTTQETELSETVNFDDDNDGGSNFVTVAKIHHEVSVLYTNVNVLNDEEDTIDISSYLSKALVYYVKARVAEDALNIDGKEYFMKEFRKMVEKYNNTRISGARMQAPGPFAIR